jgi:hypothetical protein
MHQDGLTPTWQAVSTPSSLFVDLYELTMVESYLADRMQARPPSASSRASCPRDGAATWRLASTTS